MRSGAWTLTLWPMNLWRTATAHQDWSDQSGGIDFHKLRMQRVAEAVLALSTAATGFTASDLAQRVRVMSVEVESAYGPRRAAYDLKNCGSKDWFVRLGPHAAVTLNQPACGQ
jgi:hypothetical protein